MIVEQPLLPRLSIVRVVHGYWEPQPDVWVVDVPEQIIHHPPVVIFETSGDDVDGWTIRSFTDPGGLGVTRAVIHSLDLGDDPPALRVMADGGAGTSKPTPSAHIGRQLPVTPGLYRLTADIRSNHESALARIDFGSQSAVSEPWPTPTTIELEEQVTGDSITLTLSSIDNPASSVPGRSVQTLFDNLRVEIPGWTETIPEQGHWEPQPDVWVEDGLERRVNLPIGPATSITIRRGGTRTGVGMRMDVGTCVFHVRNAYDPLDGGQLAPEQTIIVNLWVPYLSGFRAVPLFTGRIVDIAAAYPLDKSTGESSSSVVVTCADAVRRHVATPRYGVRLPAPYYETFEQRIGRLAESSLEPVVVPVEGDPIVRYAL